MVEIYLFDWYNIVVVGYLNGVNIVGSLLFYYENFLKGVVFFYLMVLRRGIEVFKIDVFIFIGVGKNDFICLVLEMEEFFVFLEKVGVDV